MFLYLYCYSISHTFNICIKVYSKKNDVFIKGTIYILTVKI